MTSSDSSSLYTSTVQSCSLLMQHSCPTLAFKSLIPLPPTSYLLPLPYHHRLSSCFLFSSLTPSGLFNGMLEIFEPGALNLYTFFHLIPLTSFVSKNLTLFHLPLLGSLDSLLCDLIAPTLGLAFSLLMPRTLAAVSSFLSGRAYPWDFLPLLLTSALIM